MRKLITSILFVAIIALSAYHFDKSTKNDSKGITVEINFGKDKESQQATINWQKQMTALMALQRVATVETHPVGNYIFVTAIDGVKGERGVTAWYYQINGKPTKTLAIDAILKEGDTITWIYKKDVCSETVDGKKNKTTECKQ